VSRSPTPGGTPGTPLEFSVRLILSTAVHNSSNAKCPYRAAIRTIVAGLQPTIFATLAIGTQALSILDTAVDTDRGSDRPEVQFPSWWSFPLDGAESNVFGCTFEDLRCAHLRCLPCFFLNWTQRFGKLMFPHCRVRMAPDIFGFLNFFSQKFFVSNRRKWGAYSPVLARHGQHRRGSKKASPPQHPQPKIVLAMRQVRIRLNRCACDRCGHSWDSRKVLRQCPDCGTRLWNGPVVTGKKRGRPLGRVKLAKPTRERERPRMSGLLAPVIKGEPTPPVWVGSQ
jgi:hypothetical protein